MSAPGRPPSYAAGDPYQEVISAGWAPCRPEVYARLRGYPRWPTECLKQLILQGRNQCRLIPTSWYPPNGVSVTSASVTTANCNTSTVHPLIYHHFWRSPWETVSNAELLILWNSMHPEKAWTESAARRFAKFLDGCVRRGAEKIRHELDAREALRLLEEDASVTFAPLSQSVPLTPMPVVRTPLTTLTLKGTP